MKDSNDHVTIDWVDPSSVSKDRGHRAKVYVSNAARQAAYRERRKLAGPVALVGKQAAQGGERVRVPDFILLELDRLRAENEALLRLAGPLSSPLGVGDVRQDAGQGGELAWLRAENLRLRNDVARCDRLVADAMEAVEYLQRVRDELQERVLDFEAQRDRELAFFGKPIRHTLRKSKNHDASA